jgi:hypothetical protein
MKVISGGQIGADIAGLKVAKSCGFETGGWMPKDFKTLDGNHPEYADLYGCVETHDGDYPVRTRLNVQAADVTLRFGHNFQTYGERATARSIREFMKPHLDIYINPISGEYHPQPLYVIDWLWVYKPTVINIAGNAHKGIEDIVMYFLQTVFIQYP